MTYAYVAAKACVVRANAEPDVAYVSVALEDALRGSDDEDVWPLAASVVPLSTARASRTAMCASGRTVWVRPLPPEMELSDAEPMLMYAHADVASETDVAVRAVRPLALDAVYLAAAPAEYDSLAHDVRAVHAALEGHIVCARTVFPVLGAACRVLMAEPVSQGMVESSTRVYVVKDVHAAAAAEARASVSSVAPPPAIDERFLANVESAASLSFRARIVPDAQLVQDAVDAWRQRNDTYVDVESVVLVRESALANLALFDGDWAVASVWPERRPRVVRVLATGAHLGADEAFIPPMLAQNLCDPAEVDPLRTLAVHLAALPARVVDEAAQARGVAFSPARPPLMPLAESVSLAVVASPYTTDRAYEAACTDALRAHLASSPRILRAGDVMAVAIDGGKARFQHVDAEREHAPSDEARESAHALRLPGAAGAAGAAACERHAVYFCVTDVAAELVDPDTLQDALPPASEAPALRQWYMTLLASGSMAGAGCWVDAEHTQVLQSGTVQRRVVAEGLDAWLGLCSRVPPCPPDGTPLTQSGTPFARLAALLHAALAKQAQKLGVHMHVLIDGARGVGKRTLVAWAAQRAGIHVLELSCALLVGDTDAHTEGALRARCERVRACAPCVLVLRDVDMLVRRGAGEAQQSAAVKMLQRCIADEHDALPLVVATTDDAERCPSSMRALFNETLSLSPPSEAERAQWLRMALHAYDVGADVDVASLAVQTAALLAADLRDVVERARLERVQELVATGAELGDVVAARPTISAASLDRALAHVRASYSESIGAPKIPNVTWDDVGGLASVKHEILDTVQLPLEHPELFSDGVKKRSGVLLYGPPGTGKTLLAKAVATTCALNFFSVKGPELLNMYIGESEANVRRVFQKARDAKPCVIFFDELDSIAPKRGNQGDSGGVMDRIVSQLLAELDGMASGSAAGDVFVIGATNRPDLLDPALLRPGRFDRLLYLSVAETHDAQLNILQALTRKFALDDDVGDMRVIAEQCPFHLTGADFYALCSDAMLKAMTSKAAEIDAAVARINAATEPRTPAQAHWPTPMTVPFYLSELAAPDEVRVRVHRRHFEDALRELSPSVSPQEMAHYREVQKAFSQPDAASAGGDAGDRADGGDAEPAVRRDKGKGKARA